MNPMQQALVWELGSHPRKFRFVETLRKISKKSGTKF